MTRECHTCRYWARPAKWERLIEDAEGECHRHAPVPLHGQLSQIKSAVALLLWGYIARHSDEATADQQLKDFYIETEGFEGTKAADWPTTSGSDSCGDWQQIELAQLSTPELLSKSVDEIAWPPLVGPRIVATLRNAGISTVEQLIQTSQNDLLATPNFGLQSLRAIRTTLRDIGLDLGIMPIETSQ